MTKRIFRNILVVALGVFLASTLLFMTVLYDYFSASFLAGSERSWIWPLGVFCMKELDILRTSKQMGSV